MIIYYLAAILATGDNYNADQNNIKLIKYDAKAYVAVASKQSPEPGMQSSGPIPQGSPYTWVTGDDYPSEALMEERQGSVGFVLQVDAKGQVTRCDIASSSGSPVLDTETCRLVLLRAKFQPAKDKRGRPITSQYTGRVRWQIPGYGSNDLTHIPTPKEMPYSIAFIPKANGSVPDCKIVRDANNPLPKNDKAQCEAGVRFVPYTKAK
jgi:TonB family protein